MEKVFLMFFMMSLTASLLVLVVLGLRLFLRRAPKALICVLWGFVAIRLIFPISLESPFSLIPSTLADTNALQIQSGTPATTADPSEDYMEPDSMQNAPIILEDTEVTEPMQDTVPLKDLSASVSVEGSPSHTVLAGNFSDTPLIHPLSAKATASSFADSAMRLLAKLWLPGVLCMLSYGIISYLHIRKKTREAVWYADNIWLCDRVETPFILGTFRPRIILPSSIQADVAEHVIAHEKAHLKRLDHVWKPLGFLLLSLYWFNPVLWIAYIFLCKDIELACDERVIRNMDTDSIKSYSFTLLNYSISGKMISVCPLSFGEVHVKKRIKNVLHYKKPAFWVIVLAVVSCLTVMVCFLTNPVAPKPPKEEEIAFLSFEMTGSGSDYIGVSLSAEPQAYFLKDTLSNITIPVQWNNNNYNSDFTFTDRFDVLYYENDTWESCAKEELLFPAILNSMPAKTEMTKTYLLTDFDFSKEGQYRFRTEPEEGKYLWLDFNTSIVRENVPETLTEEALLSILASAVRDQTNANDIIRDNPELYELLLLGGEKTVDCFVKELKKARSYGIREYFMASVCARITGIGTEEGDYDPDTWWGSADEWLAIYQKHMAALEYANRAEAQGQSPSDTPAEWKTVSTDLTALKTPAPRAMVWVNYFYHREKYPDGVLKTELPEFPGVTFIADSEKITATTSKGTKTLISGSTIWAGYWADLNNDSFPELCATVSMGENATHLGIVVYDYKNNTSYGLYDPAQYDYAMIGDIQTMYIRKTDRATKETSFVGKLSLTENTSDGTTSLALTEVHKKLYSSVWGSPVLLDLQGYSNLYHDLAMGTNRWVENDFYPILHIYSMEDFETFASGYPDVRVWTEQGVYTLYEAAKADITRLLEGCNENEHVVLYLDTHGIGYGTTELSYSIGFTSR